MTHAFATPAAATPALPSIAAAALAPWLLFAGLLAAPPAFFVTGADGAVPAVVDDGFGVVSQNAGGGKIDVFMQRTIRYDASIDAATGAVHAGLVVIGRADPALGFVLKQRAKV